MIFWNAWNDSYNIRRTHPISIPTLTSEKYIWVRDYLFLLRAASQIEHLVLGFSCVRIRFVRWERSSLEVVLFSLLFERAADFFSALFIWYPRITPYFIRFLFFPYSAHIPFPKENNVAVLHKRPNCSTRLTFSRATWAGNAQKKKCYRLICEKAMRIGRPVAAFRP